MCYTTNCQRENGSCETKQKGDKEMTPKEMLNTAISLLDWIAEEDTEEAKEVPLQAEDIRALTKAASVLCLHARMRLAR